MLRDQGHRAWHVSRFVDKSHDTVIIIEDRGLRKTEADNLAIPIANSPLELVLEKITKNSNDIAQEL
jgi:hypothetical protein